MYMISLFPRTLVSILDSILSRYQNMCLLILIITHHISKLIHGLWYLSVATLNLTSKCLHPGIFSSHLIWLLTCQTVSILAGELLESSANHFSLKYLAIILKLWWRNKTAQSTVDMHGGRFHIYIVKIHTYLIIYSIGSVWGTKKWTNQFGCICQKVLYIYIYIWIRLFGLWFISWPPKTGYLFIETWILMMGEVIYIIYSYAFALYSVSMTTMTSRKNHGCHWKNICCLFYLVTTGYALSGKY